MDAPTIMAGPEKRRIITKFARPDKDFRTAVFRAIQVVLQTR